jgi:hypothetical protein
MLRGYSLPLGEVGGAFWGSFISIIPILLKHSESIRQTESLHNNTIIASYVSNFPYICGKKELK